MRSQKGSVTVIALIMLLFLVIVGGAWTIMMTQEKTNAFADEKQQQAWYAAEAGYKRAAILLTRSKTEWVNNNTDWSWTTYDATKFKSKNESDLTKISLTDGSVITDATKVKTLPWYAVNVSQITDSTYARPTSGTTTYTITSIGEYMGERKVISREVTTKITGGSGGGGSITMGKDTIIQAGGVVNLARDSFSNSEGTTGAGKTKIVGSSIHYIRDDGNGTLDSDQYNSTWGYTYAGAAKSVLYTKIDDSAFNKSTYGTFTEAQTLTDNNAKFTVADSALVSVTWPLQWKTSWGGSGYVQTGISGGNGSVLYVTLPSTTGVYNFYQFWGDITGPSSGAPFVMIFDKDVKIDANMLTGNILIIGKGSVDIANRVGASGELMVLANGNITVEEKMSKTFLSSDGNIELTSSGHPFVGQMQAAGNVTLPEGSATGDFVLDYTVANDANFTKYIPKMLTHGS